MNTAMAQNDTRRKSPPEILRVLQFSLAGFAGPNKVRFWANLTRIRRLEWRAAQA
jgi:hypothetical protein